MGRVSDLWGKQTFFGALPSLRCVLTRRTLFIVRIQIKYFVIFGSDFENWNRIGWTNRLRVVKTSDRRAVVLPHPCFFSWSIPSTPGFPTHQQCVSAWYLASDIVKISVNLFVTKFMGDSRNSWMGFWNLFLKLPKFKIFYQSKYPKFKNSLRI